jgi:glycine/D-amino acid oxidase-like deaminating enzyme
MDLHSGYPFWLIKNGLPFEYPKLDRSIKTDVVILGGGISGALTAYHLINEAVDCVVVDARTIGLGSTCASTALLQYEIDTPLCRLKDKVGYSNAVQSYKLCVEAIDKIAEIAKKIKFPGFEFKKSLYYAAYKKDIPFLKEEFAIRKENKFKVTYLEECDIKNQYNFSAPGAILSQEGAHLDAYLFTHFLHQYSIKKGLKIYDRTLISKIQHSKKGVLLKTQDNYQLHAKKLVYATGYEVIKYIDKKIVDLHSTYAISSERMSESTKLWKDGAMIWNTAKPYLYIRTLADKRVLVGGRDEFFFNPLKRDKLIKQKSMLLAKDFCKLFPELVFKPEFSWAGTFGSTRDGLPFIGTYKKLPHSLFALGFGGNGITFSVIAAEIIADIIKGRTNKNIKLFSFDRI